MSLQPDDLLPASIRIYQDQLAPASLVILDVKAFYQGPLQTQLRHPLSHTQHRYMLITLRKYLVPKDRM